MTLLVTQPPVVMISLEAYQAMERLHIFFVRLPMQGNYSHQLPNLKWEKASSKN
ncbi:MAG: hypothetical protein K2Q13_01165 [Nitrosomonas sp.]|uniref:hypothetical protein n=1 Tax=Nitrosomonas sp. TaxID=42353 RepID=UPI0025D03061|nr:hypothetical protein [Nitrosomonas sp.]MBY0473654.1 hypothetical protein [Nitrosomonas sp.]